MAVTEITPETCGLSQSVIDQIRAVFADCSTIERALLYGSRAKGNYRHGSDIDLAVEGSELDETQLLTLETRLDDLLLPYRIDLSRLAGIQNEALRDHIQRVGRVFYQAKKNQSRLRAESANGHGARTTPEHESPLGRGRDFVVRASSPDCCPAPTQPGQDGLATHFHGKASTSSFTLVTPLQRLGKYPQTPNRAAPGSADILSAPARSAVGCSATTKPFAIDRETANRRRRSADRMSALPGANVRRPTPILAQSLQPWPPRLKPWTPEEPRA
jgi:predicted nucleotidyltransferase